MTSPEPEPVTADIGLLFGADERDRSTDDVLAAALPLLRQILEAHDRGLVAPLVGTANLRASKGRIFFENARCAPPRSAADSLRAIQEERSGALEVVARSSKIADDSGLVGERRNLAVAERGAPVTRPVHLPGFVSWEHEVGHHDPVTDIYIAGLVLASLAIGRDLGQLEHLETFVEGGRNVAALNPRIHPVVARAIERMTEVDRKKRPQDLRGLVDCLEHYREQEVKAPLDPTLLGVAAGGRRQAICAHLQSRLFDTSRRNRLLYFKQLGTALDLTEVSVPLVLDVANIPAGAILTCTPGLLGALAELEPLPLGRWIRFEDYPFAHAVLDKLRTTAARARAEYGFSSLKLAVCFLRWHDLKNEKEERIDSPLLLVPVQLVRKKGVRDTHVLTATSDTAEVNPVLRHVLKQLYAIELPDTVDLARPAAIDELHRLLDAQVKRSEPAVDVEKIEKPAIELIHTRVNRRLEAFRKRSRLGGRGVKAKAGIEYSYRRDNFQPLGLRLFSLRVSPSEAPAATLFEPPRPRHTAVAPAVRDVELYSLKRGGGDRGPYRWAFDLTSVTLANFDYQKMSLVRDYEALGADASENRAFTALFSTDARPVIAEPPPLPLEDTHPVVPADASQTATVARARTGASFIIQGPPGTGKSQTITNLIADQVARGKRVLFVCEKRVAIDVVYHRLAQLGLDRLTALIHDSQSDKKAFIAALKASYDIWVGGKSSTAGATERAARLAEFSGPLGELAAMDRLMRSAAAGSDEPLVALFRRGIELTAHRTELPPAAMERLPSRRELVAHRAAVEHVARVLTALGEGPILARHPARLLNSRVLEAERPIEVVSRAITELRPALDAVSASPAAALKDGTALTLALALERAAFITRVRPLAEAGLLGLLEAGSQLYRDFRVRLATVEASARAAAAAVAAAAAWRSPIGREDLAAVVALARRWQDKLWRFLFPSFWRLRAIMRERFDFAKSLVPPPYTQALSLLEARYAREDELAACRTEAANALGVPDLDATSALVDALHAVPETATERAVRAELLAPGAATWAEAVARSAPELDRLAAGLSAILAGHGELTPAQLGTELAALKSRLGGLPELASALRGLRGAEATATALRELPLTVEGLEAAVVERSIAASLRAEPAVAALTGRSAGLYYERLETGHAAWRRANAAHLLERAREGFIERVQQSSQPGGSADEKAFRRDYAVGRRDLEHEMGKVMRFKSIRELMTGKTGLVIRDLKPIWLMSPLSVADTLPLSTEFFDLVIFDEASQIPLEDAIPAIHRAEQCIVVGDEMQLPPTNFFGKAHDDRDLGVEWREGERTASYELDAESLLSHAARTLPSTLLAWHYRSRDEALIQFSNQAFYEGRLATVPCPTRLEPRPPIRAKDAAAGREGARLTLERPISFHRLEGAVYEGRTNRMEAEYIAEMVRGMLSLGTGQSMGIVAFSEAQQGEIEEALERLGEEDSEFEARLEAEYERTEDDQFCGLFVKNLENVQGDERDIIILSICYAPDAKGRMRMNFGPINMHGGEKRLNVIFSRARRNVAVISSIDDHHITNEHNDGANTLRCYLRYAAALSRGDTEDAAAALGRIGARMSEAEGSGDATVEGLAAALRERGWIVDIAVGGSRFRCDLAIRAKGERSHRLAVLVDTEAHYAAGDTDERYRVKPGLLASYGWRVEMVFAKDWWQSPPETIKRLELALGTLGESPREVPAGLPAHL